MLISTAGLETSKPATRDSRRLWSLWDMIELDAAYLIRLMQILFNAQCLLARTPPNLPAEMRATNVETADGLQVACEKMDLRVSAKSTDYIRYANTTAELSDAYALMKRNIHTELHGRKFFEPDAKYLRYFENLKLFGNGVFDAFPSANDDIYESGMCLSLERPTAAVLHLMRVLEAGLAALAKAVGVPKKNDWGSYIREIGEELDKRAKSAGARSADEVFYAEAAANFDRLRRAYRNPTMHPEKTYSQERAEEIMSATKSFMTHLASKVSE